MIIVLGFFSTLRQARVMYGADNQVVAAQIGPLSQQMCWVIDPDKLGLIRTHKLLCKITRMDGSEVDKDTGDENQHHPNKIYKNP